MADPLEAVKMDDAAKVAATELHDNMTLKDVALWWKRFYLVAGHKRLARVLLEHAK